MKKTYHTLFLLFIMTSFIIFLSCRDYNGSKSVTDSNSNNIDCDIIEETAVEVFDFADTCACDTTELDLNLQ